MRKAGNSFRKAAGFVDIMFTCQMTGKSEVWGTIMGKETLAGLMQCLKVKLVLHVGLKQKGLSLRKALGEDQGMDQSMVQPRKRPGRTSCLNQALHQAEGNPCFSCAG